MVNDYSGDYIFSIYNSYQNQNYSRDKFYDNFNDRLLAAIFKIMDLKIKTSANSTFAIGGASYSIDIPIAIGIMVLESFVLRINIFGKNPDLMQRLKTSAVTLLR